MRYYIFILLGLLLNINSLYSQDVKASIKNEMVKFLYFKKELPDEILTYLWKNAKDKNVAVFWYKEINLCNTNLKAFRFGTSREHSKEFIMLIKGDYEKLFLGVNMEEELKQNLFYNFIRFYDDKNVVCFYEVYNKEIMEIYKHNNFVSKLNYIEFIEIYKD